MLNDANGAADEFYALPIDHPLKKQARRKESSLRNKYHDALKAHIPESEDTVRRNDY